MSRAAPQLDMFSRSARPRQRYPDAPGFKEHTTSREAADKFASNAATLRARALALIAQHPEGLTADEIAARLLTTVLAMRPRVSELRKQGFITSTGERRTNKSGMSANVWRITGAGQRHLNGED